jgi:hypothetical protein
MAKPSKIDRIEAEVAIRNGDAPKSLQQAREMIELLREKISVAPAPTRASSSTPHPASLVTERPILRNAGPAAAPLGQPRYPSVIKSEMITCRDQNKLFALYQEFKAAEKHYGKFSGL